MIVSYPAQFKKKDGMIYVEFPDLKGCETYGKLTESGAILEAQRVLLVYVCALLEDGNELPKASSIFELKPKQGEFISLITADITNHMKEVKSVKKTLTIPSWLNERAIDANINFSSVLQEALMKNLGILR